LNPNRNPGLRAEAIEANLREYLCSGQIIWLDGEIEGDDTDGHVDQLVRFIGPAMVAVAAEHDETDVNFPPLAQLHEQLAQARIATQPITTVELPMPAPIYHDDRRLPASYANFYTANDVVIVPRFADPLDELARDTLRPYFADRQVVGVPCRELVWGLGGFHCLTCSQPK
jgi:agmatine deiminase